MTMLDHAAEAAWQASADADGDPISVDSSKAIARAVLLAIREPDDTVLGIHDCMDQLQAAILRRDFKRTIDAILAEKTA